MANSNGNPNSNLALNTFDYQIDDDFIHSLQLGSNFSGQNGGSSNPNGNGFIHHFQQQQQQQQQTQQFLHPGPGTSVTGPHVFNQNHPSHQQTVQYPNLAYGAGNMPFGPPRDVHLETHVASQFHQVTNNISLAEVYVTEVQTSRYLMPVSAANNLLSFPGGSGSALVSQGHDFYHGMSSNGGHAHNHHPNLFQNNNFHHYPQNVMMPQTQSSVHPSSSSSSSNDNFINQFLNLDQMPHTSSIQRGSVFNPTPLNQVSFTNGGSSLVHVKEEVLDQPNQLMVVGGPSSTSIIPPMALAVEPLNQFPPGQIDLFENFWGDWEDEGNFEDMEAIGNGGVVTNQLALEGPEFDVVGPDGRTHSLPHVKYGPYTCPRPGCGQVFETSQQFAAHTGSHYSQDTPEQRMRRQMRRNSRRAMNNRVVQTSEGPTVWPKNLPPPPPPPPSPAQG